MADLSILDRTVAAIKKAIIGLPPPELAALAEAEEAGKTRKTVLAALGDLPRHKVLVEDAVCNGHGGYYAAGEIIRVDPEAVGSLLEKGLIG